MNTQTKKPATRCTRCDQNLNPNMIKWLELSLTDGNYYINLPEDHESQGSFPFGTVCGIKQISDTLKKTKTHV